METISKHQYNLILKYILFLLCISLFFILPVNALANGAAGWPGIRGNEIAIYETKPFNDFIVDEEVIIDGVKDNVSVKYIITNNSTTAKDFTMIFPIEEHCKVIAMIEKIDEKLLSEEMMKFKAKLNGDDLLVQQVEPDKIKLYGEYTKLKDSACSLLTFKVKILQGENTLAINYNLIPAGFGMDGIGDDWIYTYSIWPAKNWVPKFRHALWRIILPHRIKNIEFVQQEGDWYTGKVNWHHGKGNWYKKSTEISAPGVRHDYSDHIDFTADNFLPNGQISIKLSMNLLSSIVDDCEDSDKHCESKSLKSLLEIRPFTGNKRCYDLDDLDVIKEYMSFRFSPAAIPFLRNEIFARKGYIFNTESIKQFFSEMPWYKPSLQEVKLNKIEKWNIAFLKEIEDNVKSKEDESKLKDIFKHLKDTCPSSSIK